MFFCFNFRFSPTSLLKIWFAVVSKIGNYLDGSEKLDFLFFVLPCRDFDLLDCLILNWPLMLSFWWVSPCERAKTLLMEVTHTFEYMGAEDVVET